MKLPRCAKSGKVGYPNRDQAEARALFITEFMRRTEHLRAYPCPHCNRWHLTKQPSRAHPSPAPVAPTGEPAR